MRHELCARAHGRHRAVANVGEPGALGCAAPRLDTREPVVALGEDEGQPYDRRLAETHTLPMAIGREVVVQECGHTHFLEVRDDDWYVVYSFVGCCDFFAHPTRFTHCSFSSEKSREMSGLSFKIIACVAEYKAISAVLYGCIKPLKLKSCNLSAT